MRVFDEHADAGFPNEWVALAEDLGVDRAYAHDVVGAVFSFCRRRHGATALDDGYVSFLVTRSSLVAQGRALTPERVEQLATGCTRRERVFHRALAASQDPSRLYDTYRIKLVDLRSSAVASCGQVLTVNLKKVTAGPHENLTLLWLSLFKRVAASIADWRAGNPGLDSVRVNGGRGEGACPRELRELLVDTVRQVERGTGLDPVRLTWA